MKWIAVVACAIACSSQSAKESPQPKEPDKAAAPTEAVADAATVAAADAATAGSPIPVATTQLVLGVSDDWDDATIELASYERVDGRWKQIARWPATIGHTGLAWGRGLHGNGAPKSHSGPVKAEGDGKSPAGVFSIGNAFGYAKSAPESSSVSYTQVDESWRCVDDSASKQYNRIVDEDAVAVDWKSAEDMKRRDELYRWVIEIHHNPEATPKAGSCIFFHVWRGPKGKTVGCAAMERERIESLIAWLDPAQKPVAVLLPRAELEALAAQWSLPN